MFDRILIANRGEIACRIIRTARAMGIGTVAVYSEADAQALHVELADLAVPIGGPAPADSYLRGDRIIAAALDSGAQAIHPGYGFLSENPGFVEAVEAAGLVFVGPSAAAISKMGLKDAAKRLMVEAGVPVVPGYLGEDQDPGHLEVEAHRIGYPVLIKAVAGGGGKGMRRVDRPEDFVDALESAKSEARGAFGEDAVLIEKYIEQPRHIEVQVFGDGTQAVHLFERDCSLQRRHQKVIEEAPAPGMTSDVRAAMGAAAVRAAEAIGYKGAGTVEFIVDGRGGLRSDGFWFMEMNTRLQVEHPVTEAICGVDLVEWQLRVAAGEALPARQEDLSIQGHAFEARLYAEDVPAGFLPATGRLAHLAFPAELRADTGVRSGDDISPHYDPMIAKLISHGPSRAVALQRLTRGLRDTQVAGTVTNLAFLGALAAHEGFAAGEVDTALIARDLDALIAPAAVPPATVAEAALAALGLLEADWPAMGFALWAPLERSVHLRLGEADLALQVRVISASRIEVAWLDQKVLAEKDHGGWRIGGARAQSVVRSGAALTVLGGYGTVFTHVDPLDQQGAAELASDVTVAPMPGRVVSVHVHAGQSVAAGDRLAILEAMKMEHTLVAARAGEVAEVLVREGDLVQAGAALVRLSEDVAA